MKKNISYLMTIVLLALPAALFAQGGPFCDYGWYGGPHMRFFWGGGFFMWILTIIVVALLIVFGIKLFRLKNVEQGSKESPLDIIKARYARGEITKEQFEAMKKDLGNG